MAARHQRQNNGGFAARLRTVVEDYGGASSLAKVIQRSESAVRKWLRGEAEPHVTDLRTLCDETRTDIGWLVNGNGARSERIEIRARARPAYGTKGTSSSLDRELLETVIQVLDEEIHCASVELTVTKRALLVVAAYDLSQQTKTGSEGDRATLENRQLTRWLGTSLRRVFRKTPPESFREGVTSGNRRRVVSNDDRSSDGFYIAIHVPATLLFADVIGDKDLRLIV